MSLNALANHMAAQGRGPDRTLVHMSPREIQGLQSLAQAHGKSLTVNPQTGLPEAGILEDILPSIAEGISIDPVLALWAFDPKMHACTKVEISSWISYFCYKDRA